VIIMTIDDEHIETTSNPLLMPGAGFASWLAERGVFSPEIPPKSIVARAALLLTVVNTGIIDLNEIETYFKEVGLMVPIAEN
jgi:hypothetical protein